MLALAWSQVAIGKGSGPLRFFSTPEDEDAQQVYSRQRTLAMPTLPSTYLAWR